jgi:hypothetical protein
MSQINSVLQSILSTDKYCKSDAQTYEKSQHQQKTKVFPCVILISKERQIIPLYNDVKITRTRTISNKTNQFVHWTLISNAQMKL